MNDNQKTMTYIAVALLALVIAWEPWAARYADPAQVSEEGQQLFPEFKDPLAARSLEVIEYDEATSELRPFKVAQSGTDWTIPSHDGYPADAQQHLAEAATSLIGLKILGVESSRPADHEMYGVIDPDPKSLRAGATGVGIRVTMKDDKDKPLADLIVGKSVKDQPDVRYVRKVGKDQVYRIAVKTDRLSTKFEDWIEKDLLKLNAFDVRQVKLTDFNSLQDLISPDGFLDLDKAYRRQVTLSYDDAKASWNLDEYKEFEEGEAQEVKLGENEALDTEKLTNLRNALDDLKIVDVRRKPKALSRDLREAENFVKDESAVQSLFQRGFVPFRLPDGKIDVLSSEGEVVCKMKDGVEYVLRFGNITNVASSNSNEKKEGEAGEDAEGSRLNRYLWVMARFDENAIPKPQLEPLPGEAAPATEKPADEAPAEETPATEAPADEKADDKSPDEAPAAPVEEKKTAEQGQADGKAAKAPADAKKADDAKAAAAAPESAKPQQGKSEEAAKSEPAKTEPAKPEPAKTEAPAADAAKTDAEPKQDGAPLTDEQRAAIEKENKRKQDEYDAQVKKGQERVKELNERFADWYYVVSDEVYRKIHLDRAEIIKAKDQNDAAAGQPGNVPDFDALHQQLGN